MKKPITLLVSILLLGCSKFKPINYEITRDKIGEFELFINIDELKSLSNVKECVIDNFKTIAYIEGDDTLYYVSKLNSKKEILELTSKSPKMKLSNGVHPKMSCRELKKIYPGIENNVRKIPFLNITTGNYAPSEYVNRDNYLTIGGLSFKLSVNEERKVKDTILTKIILTYDLWD